MTKWNSYHIFIHDVSYHDRFISDTLKPFLAHENNRITHYFFIRYWQGGPHIRLRYITKDDNCTKALLDEHVQSFFDKYSPSVTLTKEAYYQNHTFDGNRPHDDEIYWIEDRSIESIPYTPELDRYGGKEVMHLSESLFQKSSEIAMDAVGITSNDLIKKVIISTDFFHVIQSLLSSESSELLRKYYSLFWGTFKNNQMDYDKLLKNLKIIYEKRLMKNHPLEEDYYKEIFLYFQEKLNAIKAINPTFNMNYLLSSHIHMFNNRIGLRSDFEHLIPRISEVMKVGIKNG